jgi:hypothetical protein
VHEVGNLTAGAERHQDHVRASRRRETLDEQARRRGITPVHDMADMATDDVFETDEELDAFPS